MGTSLDMLRRAASTLHNLSRHPDNIPLFVKHEQRLLSLVMSQILDQGVAAILSNVLFHIGEEQQVLKLKRKAEKEREEKEEEAKKKEEEEEVKEEGKEKEEEEEKKKDEKSDPSEK